MEILTDNILPDCLTDLIVGYVNPEVKIAGLMLICELRDFTFKFLGEKKDIPESIAGTIFRYNWRLITTGFEREYIILSTESDDMMLKMLFSEYVFKKMEKMSSEIIECVECKHRLQNILYFDINRLLCEDCGKSVSGKLQKFSKNDKIIHMPESMVDILNIKLFCRILLPIEYSCETVNYVSYPDGCVMVWNNDIKKHNIEYPEYHVYDICQRYPGRFGFKLPRILGV